MAFLSSSCMGYVTSHLLQICDLEMDFNLLVVILFPQMILFVALMLIDLYSCATLIGRPAGYFPPESSFQFNFDCQAWGDDRCNAAKADLAQVGWMIASELFFNVPVLVCANLSNIPVPPNAIIKSRDVANTTMKSMYSKLLI